MGRFVAGGIAAIAAGMVLAGCGSGSETAVTSSMATTTSSNEAISEWGKDELSPSLDDIGGAFVWAGSAIKSMDFADARAGCRELDDQVDVLEAKLPSPDTGLTAAVQEMVDSFKLFARGCQRVSPGTSKAEMDEMKGYQRRGEAAMDQAVEIVTTARLNG